ncbi:hypothetical protein JB92DRAFT_3061567, partial [Gautieria morchelliformis]
MDTPTHYKPQRPFELFVGKKRPAPRSWTACSFQLHTHAMSDIAWEGLDGIYGGAADYLHRLIH